MKKQTQNFVGIIFGSIGILSAVMNLISDLSNTSIGATYAWWNYPTAAMGLLLILLSTINREKISMRMLKKRWTIDIMRLNTLTQFIVLLVITTLSTLGSHTSQWIIPMMMLTGLMGLKYRIITQKGLIILVIFFAAVIQYSASADGYHMRGIFVILFSSFFFGIAIILYSDEIKRYFLLAKQYHEQLIKMETRLKEVSGKTLDPEEIGLTPREIEVLRELCTSYGSNQEIAANLGITVHTVKTHIRKIFDKAGADDRHQLIDLFKHSFIS